MLTPHCNTVVLENLPHVTTNTFSYLLSSILAMVVAVVGLHHSIKSHNFERTQVRSSSWAISYLIVRNWSPVDLKKDMIFIFQYMQAGSKNWMKPTDRLGIVCQSFFCGNDDTSLAKWRHLALACSKGVGRKCGEMERVKCGLLPKGIYVWLWWG